MASCPSARPAAVRRFAFHGRRRPTRILCGRRRWPDRSARSRSPRRRVHVFTSASAPMLECSSSTTAATISRPEARPPFCATCAAADIIAATPPFMSCAPRPYSRPSRSTGVNGSVIPTTPTVSVWPQNISVRPLVRPSSDADDVGTSRAATGSTTTSRPLLRIAAAMKSAIAASPGAPATSVGFTELIATRSRSSRMAGSMSRSLARRRGAGCRRTGRGARCTVHRCEVHRCGLRADS